MQLYFLLGYVIPQDIEVIKYLRGFLDRNNIPLSTVNHFGWYGDTIDHHINHLEQEELIRSNFKPKLNISPSTDQQPTTSLNYDNQKLPQNPPSQPANVKPQPGIQIQVTPVNDCTQGELGLETGEKYRDNFDQDLASLKQDIQKTENDPKISNFVPEIKRKEAIDADQLDQAFLRALQDLDFNTGARLNDPQPHQGLPSDQTQNNLPHLHEKTQIFPSGFQPNPFNQTPSHFNMSRVDPQHRNDPSPITIPNTFNMSNQGQSFSVPQDQKFSSKLDDLKNPFTPSPDQLSQKMVGQTNPAQPAFQSMINPQQVVNVPHVYPLPVNPGIQVPSGHFGEQKVKNQQANRPLMTDRELVMILKRVGV